MADVIEMLSQLNGTARAAAEAKIPGLQPPPGVVPNFLDPPSEAHWVYVTLPICLAVSTPFVWIRLYTAFFILKNKGWAEYTSFAAWAFLIGYCTSAFYVVKYGGGVHQWNVPLNKAIEFGKVPLLRPCFEMIDSWTESTAQLGNTTEMIYSPAIFLAKLSILLQIRRLFDVARAGKTHVAIHVLIWANFWFYFPYLGATVFQCVPRAKIWDPFIRTGGCINLQAAFIAASVINVVSDFTILILPVYRISKLQIATRRKIGVMAIFAVGLFTCIASIMRVVVSVDTGKPDKTYYLQPPALWSAGELASAILCGCMPATAAFFNHFTPKLVRSLGLSSGRSRNHPPLDAANPQAAAAAAPQLARSSWRAPAAWNDSELLRTQDTEKGGSMEDGEMVSREPSASTGVEEVREIGGDVKGVI